MQRVDGAVHFPSQGVLCMADLHLGYESELRAKGAFIPSSENRALIGRIARMVAVTDPRIVILNGDVLHSFSRARSSDWRHLSRVRDAIGDRKTVIVSGNHDIHLGPLADKHDIAVRPWLVVGDTLFMHGDALPPDTLPLDDVGRIVIGHEHPAISLTRGPRTEIVKCYLTGGWEEQELLVLPSMFSLTEGVDVLGGDLRSPFLDQDISSFLVHVLLDGQILAFGTVADVDRLGTERL